MDLYSATDLKDYAVALLSGAGYSAAHADQAAEVLVWANARGVESHGLLRIPRYAEMVKQGTISPTAQPTVVRRNGAVATMEAKRAPGPSAMVAAMDCAIGLADEMGIGWCAARNITHAGAVGYYALRAAERGYVGIVITASIPLMAYHGAKVSGVSTNPISIAAPAQKTPLLLDMSTSTVALGKIMAAKDAGNSIPEGWAIAPDGSPANDPNDFASLTPLGGPKGSGLSLMFEVLASVLVANPVISESLSGRKGSMNGIALALNVSSFCDPAQFVEQIAQLTGQLHQLPKSEDTQDILMPGERGFRLAADRLRNGIPLASGTADRLAALAARLKVDPPKALAT